MKSLIKASEIQDGLVKINKQRALYYQKVSDKIHDLKWGTFFNGMIDESRKNKSMQIPEAASNIDLINCPKQRSKVYRLRMKVKAMIYSAYELE